MNFDYAEFDEELIGLVASGVSSNVSLVGKSTAPFDANSLGGRYRAVDRRLQSLRKSGRLKYSRKSGWEICN